MAIDIRRVDGKVIVNGGTAQEAVYEEKQTAVETVAELIERLQALPQDLPIARRTGVHGASTVRPFLFAVRVERHSGEVQFAINETMQADPNRQYVFFE